MLALADPIGQCAFPHGVAHCSMYGPSQLHMLYSSGTILSWRIVCLHTVTTPRYLIGLALTVADTPTPFVSVSALPPSVYRVSTGNQVSVLPIAPLVSAAMSSVTTAVGHSGAPHLAGARAVEAALLSAL